MVLEARQFYGYGGYGYGGTSPWYRWGRWVLLGCIIGLALLIFFATSCLNARRRRKRGVDPVYGTGWLAGTPAGHGQAQYYPQTENNTNPQYNSNNTYETAPPVYGAGQQTGIEMQQPYTQYPQAPANTYQPQTGGTEVYAPPVGPPPGQYGAETYAPPAGPPPNKPRYV